MKYRTSFIRKILSAFLFATFFTVAFLPFVNAQRPTMTVHFIDVGQGDCSLIQTPSGKTLLIDGGPEDQYYDAGKERVVPYLAALGIKKIDAIVISHAHRDHIGGLPAIISSFPTEKVYDSGYVYPSPIYEKLLRLINKLKITYITVRAGAKIELDPLVEIKVLAPPKNLPWDDPNNNSVVLQVRYKDISFLFTGDIEADAEDSLIRQFRYGLESHILKVPHHGSKTSSTDDFIDAVNPEVAVIQVGRGNRFRHPSDSVLRRYKDFGIKVYRTDLDGNIVVETDGKVYEVNKKSSVSDTIKTSSSVDN